MNLKEIEELFANRQSCREFSDRPLEIPLLEEICKAALLAPSAMNAQPWKLIAVTGEKLKETVKALQRLGMNKFAGKAQALVLVAEDKSAGVMKLGAAVKENEFVRNDLGILTAHLVLAAEAAGVGSCILGWRDEEKLRSLFSLGEKTLIPEVVALGYPAEGYELRPKKRKPFEESFLLVR